MDVTMDTGLKLLNMAIVLLSAALNIYLFFKTKQDKRFSSIEDIVEVVEKRLIGEVAQRNKDIGKLVLRITLVEKEVSSLPTHDDISAVHKRISEIATTMSALNERSVNTGRTVSNINTSLDRIEHYLLEKKP